MLKTSGQQGRSERRGDAYSVRYVEYLGDARTTLTDVFSILLALVGFERCDGQHIVASTLGATEKGPVFEHVHLAERQ
jgi:hypothetical protein